MRRTTNLRALLGAGSRRRGSLAVITALLMATLPAWAEETDASDGAGASTAEADAQNGSDESPSPTDRPIESDAGSATGEASGEPGREPVEGIESIEVTGSRLGPSNYTATGPITTLSTEDLELAGTTTVADLLEDVPAVDFSGTNAVQTNGGRGRSTVGLRGLGPGRVLVLLNGRRFVTSSNGAADAVDLNNLPPQLIADVEILRDGVSTIYGADAVAGVINVKTRTSYDGFEVNAFGGASEEGDGSIGEASFIWGKNFSRGNLTLYGNIGGFEPINSTDRSFSRSPILAASQNPDGTLNTVRDFFSIPQGALVARNFLDPTDPPDVVGFDPGPNGESFSPFATEVNGRNINDTFLISGEQYRSSLNSTYTLELGRTMEVFGETTYTRRDGKQRFSPPFLGSGGTLINPGGFTFGVFRPDGQLAGRNNPFLPSDFIDFFLRESGLIIDTTGAFGPAGEMIPAEIADAIAPNGVPLTLFRGFDEFGPRVFQNETRTFRSVLGIRGSIPMPIDALEWETYVNYGRSDNNEFVENDINFTNALASARPDICAQTPGCAVGNFFGTNGLLDTPDAFNFIRFKSRDRLKFHLKQLVVSARTTIAQLPAGKLRVAVGAEFRDENGSVSVDPVTLSGDGAGLAREGTRGRQLVREGFFEAEIPLIEGIPGIHDLRVNASGRYTDYSSFGGRYLSRYTLSYSPIEELRFRGVYSTSFRSPSISDLFLGSADSFVLVNDRCSGFPNLPEPLRSRCAALIPNPGDFNEDDPFDANLGLGQRQVRANIGGNTELAEETADSVSVGFVYTPAWARGVSFAADYFDVEVDNPIVFQSPQFRVDNCLIRGVASECSATLRGADGLISFIDSPRTNFGRLHTNGVDFSARYTAEWPIVGFVAFEVEGVYNFDFEVDSFAGRAKGNGTIGVVGGALPNMKGFFRMEIAPTASLRIGMSTQYIGEADISTRAGLPFDNVPDAMYMNVGITYEIDESYAVGLSIQNVTDKQPPLIVNGDNNTNRTYDQIGRRAILSFRGRF